MSIINSILPVYAADVSGVCSALYELGGMAVIHDASGCRSTYTTHDEPRWEERPSKIYISALTERDIVTGDTDKFIDGVIRTANKQHPLFICICASPVPIMAGIDMYTAAKRIEAATGIPTFDIPTTGAHSYICGIDKALLRIIREYTHPLPKKKGTVNIIGATPLDFHSRDVTDEICLNVREMGYDVISCIAMGSDLAEISQASSAEISLVISSGGLSAAAFLRDTYGIPFVCGVPLGKELSAQVSALLHKGEGMIKAADTDACPEAVAVGEYITANSLAVRYSSETGKPASALCTVEYGGYSPPNEKTIRQILSDADTVIADPLYRYICPGKNFIEVPHFAFSGRMYFG
ncbi:MAG: hypothetical protein IJ080_05205 [Oscillospiraceae bacterium]|nr:hypothetical protein [Oscillospiraceae bacterium]